MRLGGGWQTVQEQMATQQCHRPSQEEQIVLFNRLDVYDLPPDSGERQYESKT